MPDEVVLYDKKGTGHRVVTAESMRRILFTLYNQVNNPPASTTTNVTNQTSSAPTWSYNETPKNPSADNQNFTLMYSPSPQASLQLNVNKGAGGIPLQFSVDYTLTNNLIKLTAAIVGPYTIWGSYTYIPT
jgi:hypothetical protein